MGLNNQNQGLNKFRLAAVCLLAVAFLFHLIAIAAPNWASANTSKSDRAEHIGLWKYCTYPNGGGETCNDFVDIIYGDWLKAAQSFMVLSLFVLPAALGLNAICAFVSDMGNNMMVIGASLGVTFFAGLLTLICVCSFGDRYQEYFNNKEPLWNADGDVGVLDWAFGLTVADMIMTFVAMGLGIVGIN